MSVRNRHIPVVGNPDAGCLPNPCEFDPRPRRRSFADVCLSAVFGLLCLAPWVAMFWSGAR